MLISPLRKKSVLLGVAVTASMLIAIPMLADDAASHDWPQFRGSSRDGISPETGLLDTWPATGPREVWRHAIGEGYSGITVVGDRIYTMYAHGEGESAIERAAAFDATSGKELWHTVIGAKVETEFGNGPRATPTVDGDVVFVLGADGNLAALSRTDGTAHWQIDLKEAFGANRPHWGFSTSPIVDGDTLILEAGGTEERSYVGLDKKTGDLQWNLGEGGAGYNSAIPVEMGGKRRLVYVAGTKVRCIDPEGGLIWEHDWPAGETHAVPIFVPPNHLFASGAQGVGAKLFRVFEAGDEVKVEEVWSNDTMKNHFNASILHDGVLYGFDNATFKAMDVMTGKVLWAKRGLGKGSLVMADGDLFVLSDRGKLMLVEPSKDGFEEKGSVQAVEGRAWTAPSVAGGRIYIRNHDEIVAYDIRGGQGQ